MEISERNLICPPNILLQKAFKHTFSFALLYLSLRPAFKSKDVKFLRNFVSLEKPSTSLPFILFCLPTVKQSIHKKCTELIKRN